MKENNSEKQKIVDAVKKADSSSFTALGQYVPVHKFNSENKPLVKEKATVPIEKQEPNFCIYDGDYLKSDTISRQDLYGKTGGNFWNYFKYLLLNLPIISFFFLKIKQSRIKDSILRLDSINEDVEKLAGYFQGKAIINEKKYQQICQELIKANNIQAHIKKDILEKF